MEDFKEELKGREERIRLIFKGDMIEPNEESIVTVYYSAEDNEEYADETDPDILVNIRQVVGDLSFGSKSEGLLITVQFDTFHSNWSIKCSSIRRVDGQIFPHEIEIDLDKLALNVLFNVY